jgi:hypothetical protein
MSARRFFSAGGIPHFEGANMNALQEFLQEEGWMQLIAILGCFLITLVYYLLDKWKNRKR